MKSSGNDYNHFMLLQLQNYRLGHGDTMAGETVVPPCRVETFSKLQIRVISVSCGQKHTVALTQQGVNSFETFIYTCMM